jgi:hypothetical protein
VQVCGGEDYGGEAAGWAAGVPAVFAALIVNMSKKTHRLLSCEVN